MKKIYFFAVAIMAAMLFTSCITVCHDPYNPLDRTGQVVFTGTIDDVTTRISGTTWVEGNAIGVFVVPTGANDFTTLIAENRRFVTSGLGNNTLGHFNPATLSDVITLPSTTGNNYDFIAYYPYAALTNFTFPRNVTHQADAAIFDLLWARNNAPGTTPAVPLTFGRRMSQVRLVVTATQPTATLPLAGMTARIDNLYIVGSMNVITGVVTASTTGYTTQLTPTMGVSGGNDVATSTFIVPPQTLDGATVRLEADGRVWNVALPTQSLQYGRSYTFNIQVTGDLARTVSISGTPIIGDWIPGVEQNVPGVQNPTPPAPEFGVGAGETNLSFAMAGAPQTITLTAEAGLDWTITDDSNPWLSGTAISPRTGTGTGAPQTITITPPANTGVWRDATITISCDANSVQAIEIDVVQGGLLFSGSNFNDWSAFTTSLIGSPHAIATENPTGGQDNSGALHINGTLNTSGNPPMFTAVLPVGFAAGGSTISFEMYGTADRNLSIVLLAGTATVGAFNMPTTNFGTANVYNVPFFIHADPETPHFAPSYGGSINTGGVWRTVTLDLSTVPAADLARINRFRINVGGPTAAQVTAGNFMDWNLRIDNITIQ